NDDGNHLREIHRGYQVIVQERRVAHFPVAVDDEFLMERGANSHGEPALDLSGTVERIDRFSYVMRSGHAYQLDLAALLVNENLCRLSGVHVEGRGMIAVAGLEVQVFAYLVGVESLGAQNSFRPQFSPDDLAQRQGYLRLILQVKPAVGEFDFSFLRFEHRQ